MLRNWNRREVVFAAGLVLLSLLLAGCGGLFQNPVVKEAVPIAPSAPAIIYRPDPRLLGESLISGEYIPDRLVVGHRTTTKGYENFGKIFALLGEEIVAEVILDDVRIVSFRLKNGLSVEEALGLALLLVTGKLDPENPREPMEDILFVEPDYEFRPPDPREPGLDAKALEPLVYDPNADLRPFQWGLDAVNAEAAWAMGYTGAGIIVAVMDTGIDSTHPDLQGKVIRRFDCRANSEQDPTLNFDTYGHGTHCAGIIAAKNDGKGVVGLAYDVQLYDVRIFDPNFIGTVNYARGVKWAVDNGAKVLSNSWGGGAYSQVIKAAVDYATSRGVISVVSAGNDYIAMWRRPASIPGAIAVAATTPFGKAAPFSTPGSWVSVAAPGVRVLSSVRSQIIQDGTGLPLLYDYWDGTSMACPHVSALVALILQKYPSATPYQVKKLLEATAKDIETPGFDPKTGFGLIQADKALTAALPPDNGGSLRIHVVTASSSYVWGEPWPVAYMDITLRKDNRVIAVAQTDFEGFYYLGFPLGDYDPGYGVSYFPILEPGTYEVLVGGNDTNLFNSRTANRVTAKTTVTVQAGQVTTVTVPVNTTLEVTLTWTGGGEDTDIDLAVGEPYLGPGGGTRWTSAKSPGYWGSWSTDASGASGTEKYTLYAPGEGPLGGHGDDAFYPLAVVFNGGTPATVTVTVKQNGVAENYTFTLTSPGWYYAYTAGPPASRWPGWWNNYPGPYVF
jgi:hypothetical protein